MLAVPVNVQGPDPVRARLEELIDERGTDFATLSVMLGRNAAYMQQFMRRGTPKRLDEDDRLRLAQHFQIDECELGAREPWTPSQTAM